MEKHGKSLSFPLPGQYFLSEGNPNPVFDIFGFPSGIEDSLAFFQAQA
jgi:hypothetical protein